ncbi:uncharacterized protein GGS25DRAFT_408690 [Hypoxylon fragiforme]|uniref:uncharacterized protein n=1 Tax=Hypoxylon fragiforme TaxID=63214 RepID=UPI0020C70371|nr:uncharacterized protein GGS25DRAFT_408690 [Hypoxylon fragiforme]KAI2604992.1 hypothetical protein GGS25DRAFT_408690 [Hypoxylon fragiforme]
MDQKVDDLLRRPLYVYDLPDQVLCTLALKQDVRDELPNTTSEENKPRSPGRKEAQNIPDNTPSSSIVGSQSCSLCVFSFTNVQDQRSHLKSDLHHYNLKRKSRGHKPVSEAEFETLIATLDESLSGSDSSDSDEEDNHNDKENGLLTTLLKKQATLADRKGAINIANDDDDGGGGARFTRRKPKGVTGLPLLWFSSPLLPPNKYFGIYRSILTLEESKDDGQIVETIKKKQLEPIPVPKPGPDGNFTSTSYKGPHIFLCMIGGGHFAAMVVSLAPRQTKHGSVGPLNREAIVLAHKTFHRYTTRRKQGGSQSANDNAKGNAHSAGSSIRRYNEQALTDEVRLLLQEWKILLDTSELLFIRATGSTNRRTLFGPYEGQVLRGNDPRIRGFPFSTRRATQNELMRSFIELTRLKIYEIEQKQDTKGEEEQSVKTTPKPAKPAAPTLTEEEETALLHTSQLQAFIRRSKLPGLLSYLKSNNLPAEFLFQPTDSQQNHHAPTPLHLAANQNSAPIVQGLLVKGGADPTFKNQEGKTAFELAGDRTTRDAFRVSRDKLGEARWDWEAAKVPPPLKKEEADKREERERQENMKQEAERRKAEEERLRKEGPKITQSNNKTRGGTLMDAGPRKTAQDKREEEARGLTVEQRTKLDRERRARAAEERVRRMQQENST